MVDTDTLSAEIAVEEKQAEVVDTGLGAAETAAGPQQTAVMDTKSSSSRNGYRTERYNSGNKFGYNRDGCRKMTTCKGGYNFWCNRDGCRATDCNGGNRSWWTCL